jgi:hypothetical protein
MIWRLKLPTYSFLNTETDEIEEHKFSYTKLEEFKKNNPNLQMHFTAKDFPVYGDGMRMSTPGVGQPDARFEREVIGRMIKNVPGNRIAQSHKTKMPREW